MLHLTEFKFGDVVELDEDFLYFRKGGRVKVTEGYGTHDFIDRFKTGRGSEENIIVVIQHAPPLAPGPKQGCYLSRLKKAESIQLELFSP